MIIYKTANLFGKLGYTFSVHLTLYLQKITSDETGWSKVDIKSLKTKSIKLEHLKFSKKIN